MSKEIFKDLTEKKSAATYESDREIILEEMVTVQRELDKEFNFLREILSLPFVEMEEAKAKVVNNVKEIILSLQQQVEVLRVELKLLRETSGPADKEDKEVPLIN